METIQLEQNVSFAPTVLPEEQPRNSDVSTSYDNSGVELDNEVEVEEDDEEESINLRRKIREPFSNSLRKYVEHIDISNIVHMSTYELRMLYGEILDTITSSTSNHLTRPLLTFGLKAAEAIGVKFLGLNVQHAADTCLQSDQVLESFDFMMLGYNMPKMSPETQLLAAVVMTFSHIHQVNTASMPPSINPANPDKVVDIFPNGPVDDGVVEMYSDL
jgi:hypothetical protein